MAGSSSVWDEKQGICSCWRLISGCTPPSLLSSAYHIHFFLFWDFLLHNANKFLTFPPFKKISIFDLNFFCSYCFCFLLFTKFLNTAKIFSLFYERTHLVFCSLQPHARLSWVLEPSYNFKLYPIRFLWHVVWAPFPCMALLLLLSVSAAQPPLPCVGHMKSALGPCVPKLCTECAKQYSNNCTWGWMHSFTHAHDKLANRNVDNEKDKTHNIILSYWQSAGLLNIFLLIFILVSSFYSRYPNFSRCFQYVNLNFTIELQDQFNWGWTS